MSTPRVKRSDSRTFLGAGLVILASIGLLVVFAQLLSAMIPPVSAAPFRVWIALLGSMALLLAASAVLSARSILWQVPLQSVAAAALIIGVSFLVEAAFRNPHWLTSTGAQLAAAYLLFGAAAAWLMRYLQKRFL